MPNSLAAEYRRDPWLGEWVLIAPGRAARPGAISVELPPDPAAAETSPFLEGRETESPPEVFALRPSGSPANGPGWRVRVVANKYPALVAGPAGKWPERVPHAATAVLEARPAAGRHEVIVECPHFESNLARLSVEAIRDVLFVYRQRLRALRDEGWAYASVFKNKGRAAGATVAHAHSQVLALPTIPETIGREIARARGHFERHGESAVTAAIRAERADGRRILAEEGGCFAFCPFASRFAYECRISPVAPAACFDRIPDERLDDLASLLRRTLRAVEGVLGEFAYNLVLRTLPFTEPPDVPWYRWSLDLLPRLGRLAGFELGGGPLINPVAPERAAAEIRAAL